MLKPLKFNEKVFTCGEMGGSFDFKESFSERLKTMQNDQTTNIYISNLPVSMSEDALKIELESRDVALMSCRILREAQTGLSRGVGFARFATRWEAETIIQALNDVSLESFVCECARYIH